MKIFVSGSVAYDIILDYPGRFAKHIDPKKVHVLSLSFLVNNIKKSYGGTAANIAYNLAMLGANVEMIGAVGQEDKSLIRSYQAKGIGTSYIKVSRNHGTASAFIITDQDDNQIAGFYPGAMNEAARRPRLKPDDFAIIAAEKPENMVKLAKDYQSTGHRYVFDPGQQVIALSKKQMQICLKGASIVIGNDYEIDQMMKVLTPSPTFAKAMAGRQSPPSLSPFGRSLRREGEKQRKNFSPMIRGRGRGGRFPAVLIRTLGPKGSEILFPNGKKIKIGIAKPKRVVDPTGAGDAYRAGLVKGIISGLDLKRSAQLGAVAAVFAVEKYGTQNHKFNYQTLVKRHNKNFSDKI